VKLWREKKRPFHTYKELREKDWTRFVKKCESENFAANSQYMQWLRSQNELDHHLNNTSYAGKQTKQQQEDERLAQQCIENPYDKFYGQLATFMCARSKLTESDNVNFYSQSTSEVTQRALRESSEDSNGERENDALTKALQTKGQRGYVHGVSSKLTWKESFLQHEYMYQK
jgi:LPS O-antigen subunit length determinant protein (WzzB/FepE family)